MNRIKALISTAIIFFLLSNVVFALTSNKIDNQLFIIRVTSKQPQDIEGSYLAITNRDSHFVNIHQQTPFEVTVEASAINAIFHTAPENSFLRVQLLQEKGGKEERLVEGKGHAIIINSRSAECKNAFIVSR